MARITVEDCIDKFPSRFELVLVASNRARKLHSGEEPTVEIDNDKNTVIALREIAEETVTVEKLKNDLIEVPHPRMHLRNYVLLPLNELNPYWQHPIYKKKIYYFIKSLNFKSRLEITRLKKNAII